MPRLMHVIRLLLLLVPAVGWLTTPPAQAAEAVGVVLMHGKGSPGPKYVGSLADRLRDAGYLVSTPDMPWSASRIYDASYEAAMGEIDRAIERLKEKGATRFVVAGHSLGEYSALAAAKTFSLSDTARLLKLRGQSMQKAVPVGQGAMAALLGADFEQAVEIAAAAAQGEVCAAANDNAPGQVVVSGHKTAVERAIALDKSFREAAASDPDLASLRSAEAGPGATDGG